MAPYAANTTSDQAKRGAWNTDSKAHIDRSQVNRRTVYFPWDSTWPTKKEQNARYDRMYAERSKH